MAVGDWVPCQNYGSQQIAELQIAPAVPGFFLNVILVQPGDALGEFAQVAVVEPEEEVITKRVVGWVTHRASPDQDRTVIVHERIRVALLDVDGNLSFFALDLQDQNDANEPFLWERVSQLELFAGLITSWPSPDVGTMDYSRIDVSVARKLSRSEALVYSVQWNFVGAGEVSPNDIFTTFPYLRTWARTKM